MKYLLLLSVFVAAVVIVVPVNFAQPEQGSAQEIILKSGGELGLEISHIKYEEPDFMEEKGIMYGISGAFTSHNNNLMIKVDGRFSFGQVDYSSSVSGTLDSIDDYNIETRLSIGYDFRASEKAFITPYIGIGYRYLLDDFGGKYTSTGAAGYDRESNYLYSPIGLDGIVSLGNGWSLGATAEYDLFWLGLQRSHLGDVGYGLGDLDNDQKEGWGARGSVRIVKNSEKIDFVIEPFVRYWDIKKSQESTITYYNFAIGTGYEPANKSTEWGLKLALRF